VTEFPNVDRAGRTVGAMIVDMGTDDTGSDVPSKPRPQRPRTRPPSRSAAGFSSALGTVGATVAVGQIANEDSVAPGTRFSAKSMASQRRRLGFSATECGLLIGASAQSVHNWDEGKARPRAQHLPAIIALRKLGRRHANDPGEPQGRLRRRPWRGERRGSPETSLLKEDRRRTPPALRRAASARPVQSRRSLLATLSRRSMWQVVAPKADRR